MKKESNEKPPSDYSLGGFLFASKLTHLVWVYGFCITSLRVTTLLRFSVKGVVLLPVQRGEMFVLRVFLNCLDVRREYLTGERVLVREDNHPGLVEQREVVLWGNDHSLLGYPVSVLH